MCTVIEIHSVHSVDSVIFGTEVEQETLCKHNKILSILVDCTCETFNRTKITHLTFKKSVFAESTSQTYCLFCL